MRIIPLSVDLFCPLLSFQREKERGFGGGGEAAAPKPPLSPSPLSAFGQERGEGWRADECRFFGSERVSHRFLALTPPLAPRFIHPSESFVFFSHSPFGGGRGEGNQRDFAAGGFAARRKIPPSSPLSPGRRPRGEGGSRGVRSQEKPVCLAKAKSTKNHTAGERGESGHYLPGDKQGAELWNWPKRS